MLTTTQLGIPALARSLHSLVFFQYSTYGGCPTKLFFLSLYRRPFAVLSRLQKNHRCSFRAL